MAERVQTGYSTIDLGTHPKSALLGSFAGKLHERISHLKERVLLSSQSLQEDLGVDNREACVLRDVQNTQERMADFLKLHNTGVEPCILTDGVYTERIVVADPSHKSSLLRDVLREYSFPDDAIRELSTDGRTDLYVAAHGVLVVAYDSSDTVTAAAVSRLLGFFTERVDDPQPDTGLLSRVGGFTPASRPDSIPIIFIDSAQIDISLPHEIAEVVTNIIYENVVSTFAEKDYSFVSPHLTPGRISSQELRNTVRDSSLLLIWMRRVV